MIKKQYIISSFLLILINLISVYAQDRSIAVVYDNSGSMKKAGQCEGINYAFQVLVGLLHPKDELYVFKMQPPNGNKINLTNKQSSINSIRQTYNCESQNTPYTAIQNASQKLSSSHKSKKWLVILSDGEIDKSSVPSHNKLAQFVEQTGSRIIFLNVNLIESRLDRYFKDSNTTNRTLRTGGNFEAVISKMEEVASEIMTLSGGVQVQPKGSNEVVLHSPVPLKRIIVLSQQTGSGGLNTIPKVSSAKAANGNLFVEDSYGAAKSKGSNSMNGLITHIQKNNKEVIIPKGEITISFQGKPNLQRTKFLPEVAALLSVELRGNFKNVNGKLYIICDTTSQIELVAKIIDLNGKPLDTDVLKKSIVKYRNEKTGSEQTMRFEPNKKEFTAPVSVKSGGRLPVSVYAEFKGYFQYTSSIYTLEEQACPIPTAIIKANKTSLRAKVSQINNAETIVITPEIIDINGNKRKPTQAELDNLEIVQINKTRLGIKTERHGEKLYLRPAIWSKCFARTGADRIDVELKSKTPHIKIGKDSRLSIDVMIEDAPFWERYGMCIIMALISLFLLWYIFGIFKKPRFARGSEIVLEKISTFKKKPKSYPLPNGFFKRYLIPYTPEQSVVGSVNFKAGSRDSHILVSAKTQNENMYISGLPIDEPGKEDRRLSQGENLEIKRRQRKEIYTYRKIH